MAGQGSKSVPPGRRSRRRRPRGPRWVRGGGSPAVLLSPPSLGPLPPASPAPVTVALILPPDGDMRTVTLPATATVRDALLASHSVDAHLDPLLHTAHTGDEDRPLDGGTALASLAAPRALWVCPLPAAAPPPRVGPPRKPADYGARLRSLQRATRHDIRVCRWCLDCHNCELERAAAALLCIAPLPRAPAPPSVPISLVLLLPPGDGRHSAALAATATVRDAWRAVAAVDASLDPTRFDLCTLAAEPLAPDCALASLPLPRVLRACERRSGRPGGI
jgi:hypothetical protein